MEQLLENIQMDRDFPFLFYRFHYDENTAFSYYHYHNYIEITLVWNGAIEYSFEDGTKVRAGAGDIVLVNNVEPHSVRGTKERASIAVLGFCPISCGTARATRIFPISKVFSTAAKYSKTTFPLPARTATRSFRSSVRSASSATEKRTATK